jgi:hypothetical protein
MRAVISTLLPIRHGGAPPGEPPATLAATAECDARGATSIAALVRIRENPFRTPGKKDKPFRHPAFAPVVPKKPAPSLL